jgi:hypothetical protein
LFAAWKARNTTKWAINRGISLEFADPDREANLSLADDSPSAASASELSRLIDSELPVSLRIDYLRMRDGLKVPKDRRVAVQRAVADILRRAGVDVPFPADDGWKSAWEAAQGAARQQLEASGFDKTSIETFTEKELQESANSTPAGSVAP